MSFFFTKPKAKPAQRGGTPAKATQANLASKQSLNRLGCRTCPLDKAGNFTPKMKPDLANETDIYFLGGSPSDVDDDKGVPFSDSAGKLLKSLIGPSVRKHCSYDNVIRDFNDPFSKSPAPDWVPMESCRGHVGKEIAAAQPRIIVGLGIQPLQWMLNSSDMMGLRGRVFAVMVGGHKCWFMPTYDPQYVIDSAFDNNEPLRSKLGHCLKFDVARAIELAKTLPTPRIDTPQGARAGIQPFNGRTPGQLAQVLKLISEARKAPEKAIDVETSCLSPYEAKAAVLTVAISFKDINFSFAVDHSKAGWRPTEKWAIKKALSDLLTDETTIVAHNAPFEVSWMVFLLGLDSIVHDNWECTMMQAHFLDERRGKRGGNDEQFQPNPYQALDFLVKQHYGLAYKALFKLNRKEMALADLDETLLYNGADTKYTLRLYYDQDARLKAEGLRSAYREAAPRQPAVAIMQSIGIDLDQKQNKLMADKLKGEIKEIEGRMNKLPVVRQFIADRKEFNPASGPDVVRIFKDYVKVNITNDLGKDSTDKNMLATIDHPLAKIIEDHRNRSKLKSTYVDVFTLGSGEFIYPDGKIHPSCNTTFAETGRTSSDTPNNQNWPKRNDAWVRRQVAAKKGYILVAFDFGQLEACTAAMCTRDKVLVKALWEDYDIHMEWAIKAAHRHPDSIGGLENLKDKAVMKKFRSVVKNKLVFPAMFGASNQSVAGYLDMPIEPVDKLMSEFWRTFSGLHNWQKQIMKNYYEEGYVESLTGRRRHYPLSKNQAVNYPIQSVACDIVCRAMVSLSKIASDTGAWYLHPIMNIHDDLTFAIPDDEKLLEEAIEIIYRVMLQPVYKFMNVPMSVECSVGHNWLEMKEIGKFWSHKDL
jgi:uracil-DNA glycosylase family 4